MLFYSLLLMLIPSTFCFVISGVCKFKLFVSVLSSAAYYSFDDNAVLSLLFGIAVYIFCTVIINVVSIVNKHGYGLVLNREDNNSLSVFTPKRILSYKTAFAKNIHNGEVIVIEDLSKIE